MLFLSTVVNAQVPVILLKHVNNIPFNFFPRLRAVVVTVAWRTLDHVTQEVTVKKFANLAMTVTIWSAMQLICTGKIWLLLIACFNRYGTFINYVNSTRPWSV